jgi:hypothetical protein
MREANKAPRSEGPQCSCWSCTVTRRKKRDQDTLPRGAACNFKPWFEGLLTQCGKSTDTGVQRGQEVIMGRHMSIDYDDGGRIYDVDAHFVHLMRDDWYTWRYGAYLWKDGSAEDPELAKPHALWALLELFMYLD